ncbi:MAG TPA: hypothetical protein VGR66_09700 [Candidatus Eisenbacteria bacterium]|jgi:hypothetical protein|nr:hypothetical protein [Candidatus Eisenbacteria bacterium]
MNEMVTSRAYRHRKLALGIAMAADVLQWVFLPLLAAIVPTAIDDVVDVIVGIVMIRLLGWHPAFLPTVIAELVPGLNLLPTWTAAVWFVTRKRKALATPIEPELPKLP